LHDLLKLFGDFAEQLKANLPYKT